MVYDCFSYWDEDLLLDLRLNILNNHVDYFVIIEGNKTWQNNPKKLSFNIDKFSKFKEKIIYVPVSDLPDGNDPYLRENYQRNCISKGIVDAKDDDLILISDLDEIPNPKNLNKFSTKMRFAVFKQKHFYYKFNLRSKKNPFWYGSRICIKKYLKSPQWLRELKFKKRPFWRIDKFRLNNIIENGGWHFCNLKTPEKLLYKYKNLCETNDPFHFKNKINEKYLNINNVEEKLLNKKDIIGRDDSFFKENIDETFPEFLTRNLNKYKKWVEL
tara:strand:+ start:2701 stop:3513 length:813 start_codon:yes stop_codon:yes gene_type:complete